MYDVQRYAVRLNDKNSRWKQSNVDISFDFKCRIRILVFALYSHSNVWLILVRQSSSKWYFLSVHSLVLPSHIKCRIPSHFFAALYKIQITSLSMSSIVVIWRYVYFLLFRSLSLFAVVLLLQSQEVHTHTHSDSLSILGRARAHKYERVRVRLYLHFEVYRSDMPFERLAAYFTVNANFIKTNGIPTIIHIILNSTATATIAVGCCFCVHVVFTWNLPTYHHRSSYIVRLLGTKVQFCFLRHVSYIVSTLCFCSCRRSISHSTHFSILCEYTHISKVSIANMLCYGVYTNNIFQINRCNANCPNAASR